jgi:Domain of unknown function (DUF4337)
MDEITEAGDNTRARWTAVLIGILAVLLAICTMGGDNAAKDANRANIDATNTWAFFQAKNIRRHELRLAVDSLELQLIAAPGLVPVARSAVEAKIADYKAQEAKLTSEPKDSTGLDELFLKGKALETVRDAAFARDPYFDWGQALLQIAIVVASVSIISASRMLLGFSGVLGALGALLTLQGFTMVVPFLSS